MLLRECRNDCPESFYPHGGPGDDTLGAQMDVESGIPVLHPTAGILGSSGMALEIQERLQPFPCTTIGSLAQRPAHGKSQLL